ncbi:UPF0702 transmembrane protein YetF [Oceanobacillus oncorhynchi subsp. incaldanensis]|uniref:DUF421 domain-containing protein n=2 Tax=Oceanobacillus TaxID=182709 RepID=A0A0A1MN88_9BACI|nr:DUF421 domain-containing protein [Oceanobacillus oncorhynchi]MDM8101003.1 DUF421 domain-containing protein [Oceanobacillus oncorhynchi]UUI38820.1 DUF421 domain-containing protein [Oceanobacillus oncorhynchi]GIO20810.1 UPF0702 transmembrane protein YetF [Oceanobacillus oncorhynchi subsp. incaldanensis]CEI84528.1 hypothetical protein BN997_04479 [Oceanobacillus oncorhynchi]
MSSYMSMFTEVIFGFFALFLITKLLGKTQISQITPFDFISALLLGELVGNALFDPNAGIPEIAFVVALYAILMYIIEIVSQKYKRTRHLLEGSPTIIIHRGKLVRDMMKKTKLDINQLQHLLREKDVFSISEVEFAVLEANGTVSVLKKTDYQTPTRKDLKLSPQDVTLPITLINDGEIIQDNMEEKNLPLSWLEESIHEQGYKDVSEIFYAEYIKGSPLYIVPFFNRNHKKYTDYD